MKNFFLISIILTLGFSSILCSRKSKNLESECISGDCESGKGAMIFSYTRKVYTHNYDTNYNLVDTVINEEIIHNGAKYEGDWKNGKMHGKGVLTYPDSIYSGDFKDGIIDGRGTWEMRPESDWGSYTGEWKNGKKHGKGIYSSYAEFYDGEWKDDEKNGYGIYRWSDCEYSGGYIGQWKDGMRNGKGTNTNLKNDQLVDKYVGEWKDDEKNGWGIEYNSDESIKRKGRFKNNKYIGK